MTSILQERQEITDQVGKVRQFTYEILVEQVETGHLLAENYGVAVEEVGGDRVEILGITVSQRRIQELMALLCGNQVTPGSLGDVVADWL